MNKRRNWGYCHHTIRFAALVSIGRRIESNAQSRGQEELEQTLDFLLRHAMQAVLTHRLFADAEPGESLESLSLLCDFVLLPLGRESVAFGISVVVVWSGSSSSILGEPAMTETPPDSSEMQAGQLGRVVSQARMT